MGGGGKRTGTDNVSPFSPFGKNIDFKWKLHVWMRQGGAVAERWGKEGEGEVWREVERGIFHGG